MALASDVITRVRDTLLDPGTTYRWTDAEILRYITDAQRDICAPFPEANTQTELVTPGVADVRIDMRVVASATPIAILRFPSQYDEVNAIEGAELKVVEKHVMDAIDPMWVSYRPVLAAYNDDTANSRYYRAVIFDPKDRLSFWLYPRAHSDFTFYVTYTAVPVDVTTTGQTLALADQYLTAIHDYVCYRCLAKDSVYTGAPEKSMQYWESFLRRMTLITGRSLELSPTAARPPNEH